MKPLCSSVHDAIIISNERLSQIYLFLFCILFASKSENYESRFHDKLVFFYFSAFIHHELNEKQKEEDKKMEEEHKNVGGIGIVLGVS